MKNFLVGYNGSAEAKAALGLAAEHGAVLGAKIIVVVSLEGGKGEKPKEIGKATENLTDAENFLMDKDVSFECHQLVRGMKPGEDLVDFAEENEIDQIYVGIQKKSRTQKIILGSNAQYIILKAPCPVVTVNRA